MVLVPIIWRLAPAEVDGILADSGAQTLFVEPAFARDFPAAQVVVMDDGFARWRDAQSSTPPPVTVTRTPTATSPTVTVSPRTVTAPVWTRTATWPPVRTPP